MKHYFRPLAALSLSILVSSAVSTLKADEWDKKTTVRIDHSIDVQGTVLPPGSYVFKVLIPAPGRYTVQISDVKEIHIFATIFAIPTYKAVSSQDSEFKFYDESTGQPAALRAWFYPGDNIGFEFRSGRRNAMTGSTMTGNRRAHPNTPTPAAASEGGGE